METTFVIIKPNAMKKQKAGAIINRFQEEGLHLAALKMILISKEKCEEFYKEHKERAFFSELLDFISSAPVVMMALRGEGAVLKVRRLWEIQILKRRNREHFVKNMAKVLEKMQFMGVIL